MNIRYRVELSQAERQALITRLGGGWHAARKIKRAQVLLAADTGQGDDAIAAGLAVSVATVRRTKRRFVEGNLERALNEEPRPGAARKLSGRRPCWSPRRAPARLKGGRAGRWRCWPGKCCA